MKVKIRILTLFIVIVLLVAFSASCTNGKPESKEPNGAGSESSKEAPNPSTSVTQEFKDSLRGMEVTLAWPWSKEEDYLLTDPYSEAYRARLKAVEEELGITFKEFGGRTTYYTAMIPTIMAGTPMANILFSTDQYVTDYARAGVFSDLTDAATEIGLDFNAGRFNTRSIRDTTLNGRHYGFYYMRAGASCIFYNKRAFKENNQPDLIELFNKNEWTFDKLTEIAKALTKRKADGSVEFSGFDSWAASDILMSTIYANGGSMVTVGSDKKPALNLGDSKVKKAMEYVYNWGATDRLLTGDASTWDASMNDFADGKIGMLLGTDTTIDIIYSRKMQDDFGIVPFPKGPDASELIYSRSACSYFFIPKTYQSDAAKYLYIADRILGYDDNITPELYFDNVVGQKITDRNSYTAFKKGFLAPQFADYSYIAGLAWSEPSIFQIATELITGESTPSVMEARFSDMLNIVISEKWEGLTIG